MCCFAKTITLDLYFDYCGKMRLEIYLQLPFGASGPVQNSGSSIPLDSLAADENSEEIGTKEQVLIQLLFAVLQKLFTWMCTISCFCFRKTWTNRTVPVMEVRNRTSPVMDKMMRGVGRKRQQMKERGKRQRRKSDQKTRFVDRFVLKITSTVF